VTGAIPTSLYTSLTRYDRHTLPLSSSLVIIISEQDPTHTEEPIKILKRQSEVSARIRGMGHVGAGKTTRRTRDVSAEHFQLSRLERYNPTTETKITVLSCKKRFGQVCGLTKSMAAGTKRPHTVEECGDWLAVEIPDTSSKIGLKNWSSLSKKSLKNPSSLSKINIKNACSISKIYLKNRSCSGSPQIGFQKSLSKISLQNSVFPIFEDKNRSSKICLLHQKSVTKKYALLTENETQK